MHRRWDRTHAFNACYTSSAGPAMNILEESTGTGRLTWHVCSHGCLLSTRQLQTATIQSKPDIACTGRWERTAHLACMQSWMFVVHTPVANSNNSKVKKCIGRKKSSQQYGIACKHHSFYTLLLSIGSIARRKESLSAAATICALLQTSHGCTELPSRLTPLCTCDSLSLSS